MPKLIVLETAIGPEKEVDLPDGGEMLDAADEHWLPIPFSCRSATCATCHIEVVEGAEHLEPPNDEERDLLDIVRGPANGRFACQVKIRAGAGVVRVRPIE